jgi:predicted transcriptional regulator of viral defense system
MAEIARRQAGVVSVEQLHRIGLSKAAIAGRARKGLLHALHRGVYAVGHTALMRRGWEWAAVLACGPDAVLSHTTAGALWGLTWATMAIEVTTPRKLHPRAGILIHRTRRLDPVDRTSLDGIPVTSVHRTLVDLAEVLPGKRLAKAVHESEVRRLFDLKQLVEAQTRVAGRCGRRRLRRVCQQYAPPPTTRSDAEALFLELLDEAGLPAPQANATRRGHELDCLWPDASLNVEIDGAATHKTMKAFYADRRRDRELRRGGITVIRITYRDLTTGRIELERDLREILGYR